MPTQCSAALVQQYQLLHHAPDAIEVRLAVERTLGVDEQYALARIIQDSLNHPFRLSIRYFVETIPRGAGGKVEEFIRTCA